MKYMSFRETLSNVRPFQDRTNSELLSNISLLILGSAFPSIILYHHHNGITLLHSKFNVSTYMPHEKITRTIDLSSDRMTGSHKTVNQYMQ